MMKIIFCRKRYWCKILLCTSAKCCFLALVQRCKTPYIYRAFAPLALHHLKTKKTSTQIYRYGNNFIKYI